MKSKQDRWLLMLKHGLNVPDYVENPHTKHQENTYTFLKEVFFGYPYLTFLAKRGEEVREFEEEAFRDAFQKSVILEQSGYTVWLAEGVECEYTGTIWVRNDGSGKIKYQLREYRERFTFSDCESVGKIRDKIIIRRVARFAQEMRFKSVAVDFGWAYAFAGKLSEKIVFFDFKEMQSFD